MSPVRYVVATTTPDGFPSLPRITAAACSRSPDSPRLSIDRVSAEPPSAWAASRSTAARLCPGGRVGAATSTTGSRRGNDPADGTTR